MDVVGQIARLPGGAWLIKMLGRWAVRNQGSDIEDDPDRFGFKTTEYANLSGIAPFKWESTRGLGGSFGFNRNETAQDMLTGAELIRYLVDTVSNVGSDLGYPTLVCEQCRTSDRSSKSSSKHSYEPLRFVLNSEPYGRHHALHLRAVGHACDSLFVDRHRPGE